MSRLKFFSKIGKLFSNGLYTVAVVTVVFVFIAFVIGEIFAAEVTI